MNTVCKMIPISYNKFDNVYNKIKQTIRDVINIDDINFIKYNVECYLFDYKFDSILLKYNNELFICEPISRNDRRYSRRKISYHPLMNNLN